MYPEKNTYAPLFVDNGRFFDVPSKYANLISYNSMRGVIFHDQTKRYVVREYRTHIGPSFSTNTKSYLCDRQGLQGALMRMTNCRKPEIPGYHQKLIDNQFKNVGTRYHYRWARRLNRMVKLLAGDVDVDKLRYEWAYAPHPKKKERVAAYLDRYSTGIYKDTPWLPKSEKIEYKCKPQELLPMQKLLRGTGNLGVMQALQSGYIPDFLKKVMEEPCHVGIGIATYLPMNNDEIMTKAFRDLWYTNTSCFYYFSDDSCMGVTCADGNLVANCDISSCDASNYAPIFHLLMRIGDNPIWQKDWEAAFEALLAPFYIRDPNCHKYKLTFEHNDYVLFSGSVLTTLVNNVANMMIYMEFMKNFVPSMTKAQAKICYQTSAEDVGFILKLDVCECIEDLQFLKLSPVMSDNEDLVSMVNLGAWIKGFGYVKGDLPGKANVPISKRADIFNSGVINGRIHWGNHSFHDAFKALIKYDNVIDSEKSFVSSSKRIQDLSITRRYRCDMSEYYEACQLISNGKVGQRIGSKFFYRVMAKDYGYDDTLRAFEVEPINFSSD